MWIIRVIIILLVTVVVATDEATDSTIYTNSTETSTLIAQTPFKSLIGKPCSILDEYGVWNLYYKYSLSDIEDALCRCKHICEVVSVAPHVKHFIHHYLLHPLSSLNRKEFIGIVTVFSSLFLFGVTGNIYTIVRLVKRKQTPRTSVFIITLCCSDILVLCVCMPVKLIEYFRLADIYNETTCKLSYYLRDFTLVCSVLTLTVISIERYFTICRPTHSLYRCTRHRAKRIVVGTVVLSLWLALPSPFIVKHYQVPGYSECLQQAEEEVYLLLYFVFYQSVLFTLPCIIMTFAYVRACQVLWRLNSEETQLNETDRHTNEDDVVAEHIDHDNIQSRKRILRLLIIVVALFVFCWGPTQLIHLLCGLSVIRMNRRLIRLIFDALTYTSCAFNPVLFMAMSPQMYKQPFDYFRKLFQSMGSNDQQPEVSHDTESAVDL